MSIELVQATEDDRSYLLNLRKITMVKHLEKAGLYLSESEHQLRLNDSYECSHLVILSSERIGALKYKEFSEKVVIMQIQIHPRFQGRRYGKSVMDQILESSKPKTVELRVLKSNPAKQLYERLGLIVSDEYKYEFYMEAKH